MFLSHAMLNSEFCSIKFDLSYDFREIEFNEVTYMKKLISIVLTALIAFICYTDFTKGTIIHDSGFEEIDSAGVEVVAKPGDSLLVLLKRHDLLPSSFNIDQLSYEFTALNGITPQQIIAGERYLLPAPK